MVSFVDIKNYKNFFGDTSLFHLNYIESDNRKELNNSKNNTCVLIFLIDKSGSMGGLPFNLLKESINKLMPLVSDSFKNIHFIVFDSIATEIKYEQFNSINASGGTSFSNAHLKLIECINKYDDLNSFQVIYFTDGQDNVNFDTMKKYLQSTKKSITFNTCGFGSSHDANLLTKLTQMSSTYGIYKSFVRSEDINFDDFGSLFISIKSGCIKFENNLEKFFTLNSTNEEFIFLEKDSKIESVVISNEPTNINKIEEESFDELKDYNLKVTLFNLYLSELFKIEEKQNFISQVSLFKTHIKNHLCKHISVSNSIIENELISVCFRDLIDSCDNFINESKKNTDITKLKALTYDKILTNRFKRRLDQRTAKNELTFSKNFEKAKELINQNKQLIQSIDPSTIFPDVCYMTQENFVDLLQKQDCLGFCFKIARKTEVVIVNPNFLKIEDIDYSSFISLNSVFTVLKYKMDIADDSAELHGGFDNRVNSFFLDGTHRAKYNAMIPLYINEFHWKISKLLLQPLFGYIFTLNINGYTTEQFYTLYFLIYEKIILDFIQNRKSEAIQRILDQIKKSCLDIFEQFRAILEPKLDKFLENHFERTKDVIPNLNSYLIFISFDSNSMQTLKSNKLDFDYFYYEEQLRRYLKSTFKFDYKDFFCLDKNLIETSADSLFDYYFKDLEFNMDLVKKSIEIGPIINMTNGALFKELDSKCNIKFELNNSIDICNKESLNLLTEYFNKFKNAGFVKLYNYLFVSNENEEKANGYSTSSFCDDNDQIKKFALIHQLIKYGYNNQDWRAYESYVMFGTIEAANEYLLNEYFKEFRVLFNKRFNDRLENKNKLIQMVKVKLFLDWNKPDLDNFSFSNSEKIFPDLFKNLIDEININLVSYLIEKIFFVCFKTINNNQSGVYWRPTMRGKLFKLFKMIYLFETRNNMLNYENSFKFLTQRYTDNKPYAKYLYQTYSFMIDRDILKKPNVRYVDYVDNDLVIQFKLKETKPQIGSGDLLDEFKGKIKFDVFNQISSNLNTDLRNLEIKWLREQVDLKKLNILNDTEEWQKDLNKLERVAVLDIAFDPSDNSTACAGIVIFKLDHNNKRLELVYANLVDTKLNEPYISGLLAFREGPVYEYMISQIPIDLKPDCYIFDGNGILHKTEFGLASQMGVKMNCVTFGFSKKMHFIENRFSFKNLNELREYYKAHLINKDDFIDLKTTDTNTILGYAYLSGNRSTNPVFISQGNKISGETCLKIVKLCNDYLENMNIDTRESVVGIVDKISNWNLNERNNLSRNLRQFFKNLF